jgi:hypothetical protein
MNGECETRYTDTRYEDSVLGVWDFSDARGDGEHGSYQKV